MTMMLTKKPGLSKLLARHPKDETEQIKPTEKEETTPLSEIQTLPFELKLQILEEAANILVVKNLVIACPSFYPVYRENRYKILLNAHRKSQDRRTEVLANAVLNIHKLDGTGSSGNEEAWLVWKKSREDYDHPASVSFVDTQPSLSDLVEVSRVHCWVLERFEELSRTSVQSKSRTTCPLYNHPRQTYKYLYCIEIFAAIIDDKDRGWAAASLPKSVWENEVKCFWDISDFNTMSEIVKIIWPYRSKETPRCRRRTRILLSRIARQRRPGIDYTE
jgi:hypothetical protein